MVSQSQNAWLAGAWTNVGDESSWPTTSRLRLPVSIPVATIRVSVTNQCSLRPGYTDFEVTYYLRQQLTARPLGDLYDTEHNPDVGVQACGSYS
jgi:hypothetical protein